MSPSREPRWLDRTMVMAIHADQILQHGGSHGLRDESALESALAHSRTRWHYTRGVELSELGAAYGFGIAKNHAFVDGNKRTAFQAMYVFMGLNGWRIRSDEDDVVTRSEGVAEGRIDEPALAMWLRGHIVRRRGRRT